MIHSVLAWDEIESIGYRLFEDGYIYRNKDNAKPIYGVGMSEASLYSLSKRMQDGDDIRAELAIAVIGKTHSFVTSNGNKFSVEYGENGFTAHYGNAERQVSYVDLGDKLIGVIKSEYDDIVNGRTIENLRYIFPDITDETADKLINAFDNATMNGWNNDKLTNNAKINRIKKALYNILGDEENTEKAFASIADMKYNYKVERPKNSIETLTGALPFYTDDCTVSKTSGSFVVTQNIRKMELFNADKYEYLGNENEKAQSPLATENNSLDVYADLKAEEITSPIADTPYSENPVDGSYRIYQLGNDEKYHGIRFMNYDFNLQSGVVLNNEDYDFMYEGDLSEFKGENLLEEIYQKFNMDRPDDFTGHSLSVSDVVVIESDGKQTAYYVNDIDYKELPDFFKEKNIELETESPMATENNSKNGNFIPVYKGDWEIRSNTELYSKIIAENKRFADRAKEVIGNSKNPDDSVKALTSEFGFERTAWLTALNIAAHPSDGRFYKADKEWACKILSPYLDIKPDEFLSYNSEKRHRFDKFINGGELYTTHNTHIAQFAESLMPEYEKYLKREKSPLTNDTVRQFRDKTQEKFNPIDGLTVEDIESDIFAYIQNVLEENNIDYDEQSIGGVIYGSRSRGIENANSDIDFVVEIDTHEREDSLFNLLNDSNKPLRISNVKVDINPITPYETGTLETYLPTAEKYLEKKIAMENSKKVLSWNDIFNAAIDKPFDSDELTAKDEARAQMVSLIEEIKGVYIEENSLGYTSIEELIESYCDEWNIKFDINGNIVKHMDMLTVDSKEFFLEEPLDDGSWSVIASAKINGVEYFELENDNYNYPENTGHIVVNKMSELVYDNLYDDMTNENDYALLRAANSGEEGDITDIIAKFDKSKQQEKQTSPQQLDLFGNSMPVNEKPEKLQILDRDIMRGSGIEDGKFRIHEFYRNNKPTNKEFVDFLKKEYGIGGHSRDEVIRFQNHDSKGIGLELVYGEKLNFSWIAVAKEIGDLIDHDQYITAEDIAERKRFAMYTVSNYNEVTANEHDRRKYQKALKIISDSDNTSIANGDSKAVDYHIKDDDISAGGRKVAV